MIPADTTTFALTLLAAFAATMVISYLTYRAIELPGQTFGKRLIKRFNASRPAMPIENATIT